MNAEIAAIQILDQFDRMVDDAQGVPLTRQVRVSRDDAAELVTRLRDAFGDEVEAARAIVGQQQQALVDARDEAGRIATQAREDRERLVAHTEQVGLARRTSAEIVQSADHLAQAVRDGADDYADHILGRLHEGFSIAAGMVGTARDGLDGRARG